MYRYVLILPRSEGRNSILVYFCRRLYSIYSLRFFYNKRYCLRFFLIVLQDSVNNFHRSCSLERPTSFWYLSRSISPDAVCLDSPWMPLEQSAGLIVRISGPCSYRLDESKHVGILGWTWPRLQKRPQPVKDNGVCRSPGNPFHDIESAYLDGNDIQSVDLVEFPL